MQLKKFSVENYKVFGEKFSIEFANESIVILTGRNNTGKSTFLEAINQFFLKPSAKSKIPPESYYNQDITKEIVLIGEFKCEGQEELITIIKKYKNDNGKYYDLEENEIKRGHSLLEKLEQMIANAPYYITPYMSTDDIDDQVQEIYSQVIVSELEQLEGAEDDNAFKDIQKAIPELLKALKSNIDNTLGEVSSEVSGNLKNLFSNQSLELEVLGGESKVFSISDIVKSTSSTVNVKNRHCKDMPLSNQGTGMQRMSLIYIIQNMIEKGLMGTDDNKILLIDEPEAFLHPEAVRALSRSLYTIGLKMPLIISTHSPILIDLSENHTTIQVFRVGEDKAINLYQSSQNVFDQNDVDNMKILNYVDSYVNEFFFAEKIIIVEGDTEQIALKHFIKEKNVNVHIIKARGKSTICTLMKVLNQFNVSYYVLHDIDNHTKYELPTIKAQLTNCKKVYEHKNEHANIYGSISNFEQAIGIGDVSNNKKTETIYNIMNNSDFEAIKTKIQNLFTFILELDEEQPSLESGFIKINDTADYDALFADLLQGEELTAERAQEQVLS
ncbi:ATP-dependent nuclease [Bacillus sp. FSL R5-0677]|uniref:ATP-dependent nuclease n=1 Tax=Bacillus sp. FSL R5-0677 TaxID=2921581 RepID=UPI0030FCC21E